MKVLHVESGMHLYGGALQVVFLLRELHTRGVPCVLACPEGSAIAEAAAPFAAVRSLKMAGDLDVGLAGRLRTLIRQERPDVLHLHSRRGADVWGGVAGRLAGVPVVLSRRVDNPEGRIAVAMKYRLYDRVVTISEGIRQVLLGQGVPVAKLRCVPSAVDTEQYRPNRVSEAEVRQEFGLEPDELLIGMVAQFINRKGHRVLLDALPSVLARHPRIRVLLFGQGPESGAIAALISSSPLLSRHVVMAGFRKDLGQILPCLDLLVHPAFMEGLGVSLLQAAACGVPIIACSAGGMPEIVRPGLNGLLVEPGDAPGLSTAMQTLLADPALRQRYGHAGRQWVIERFSIEAMVQGNLNVYQELVN